MIYVISHGTYSDYEIDYLMEGPDGLNIKELKESFEQSIKNKSHELTHSWQYAEHEFKQWLEDNYDFKEIHYEECNVGYCTIFKTKPMYGPTL